MAVPFKMVKPSGRGSGITRPSGNQGSGFYFPFISNYLPVHEDFLETGISPSAGWTTSVQGSDVITSSSGIATITGTTATAATITSKLVSALSAGMNIFNIPFRVTWCARIGSLTSGQHAVFDIRDTAETTQVRIDMMATAITAATSATFTVQAGSTAAAFYVNGLLNGVVATAGYTPSSWISYGIEMTHNGVGFFSSLDPDSHEPPRLLRFVRRQAPRSDLNYIVSVRHEVASGDAVAGTSQVIDVDYIDIEHLAFDSPQPFFGTTPESQQSGMRTWISTAQINASVSGLVTSGAGVLFSVNVTTTATAAGNLYIAAYDASGFGSAVYNITTGAQQNSSISRVIWASQVQMTSSTPTGPTPLPLTPIPAGGIPFWKGLVIADVTQAMTAVGASALQAIAIYRSQPSA